MTEQYFALGLVFFAVFIGILVVLSVMSAYSSYMIQLRNVSGNDKELLIRKQNMQSGIYLGVCSAGFVLAVGWCCRIPWFFNTILALLIALGCARLPAVIRRMNIRRRNQEFEKGMLDFTVVVLNSLKAGLSLPGSIEAALENAGGPIYVEFSLVLKEHRLGVDLQTAVQNMVMRVDSENLQLFALTLSVCMKTGGSVVEVLDQVIATIRQRSEFQDKLKTMVAQSEFEATMISLSPLAAIGILYLVKPDFVVPMFVHPLGWTAMIFVIIWETIGFVIIKKVITVKY